MRYQTLIGIFLAVFCNIFTLEGEILFKDKSLCTVHGNFVQSQHHIFGIFQRIIIGDKNFLGVGFLFVNIDRTDDGQHHNHQE